LFCSHRFITMPTQDFIDVRILSNDSPLPEYQKADQTEISSRSGTRYVEAVTGQSFEIQCKLLPGYDFRQSEFVMIQIFLDHHKLPQVDIIEKGEESFRSGFLAAEAKRTISRTKVLDNTTGEWEECALIFGSLTPSKFFFSDRSDALCGQSRLVSLD
jgi:hypothetical protein